MQIQDILERLEGVKKAGPGRWMARCCGHDDRNPSLSIREGENGRPLLKCFAGCSYEHLAAILGINRERQLATAYVAPKKVPRIEPAPDLNGLWRRWEKETDYRDIDGLGMSLGVDADALQAIGCVWNGQAWGFPMKDAQKALIGIRLRAPDGRKWAVTGSRSGLFIPDRYPYCVDDGTMYLCEGPTDLAAAMTLGLYAIGRPSCLGQEEMILAYIRNVKVRRLVVITDNDQAGLNGARKLQGMLKIRSCLYVPPAKDIRQFAILGGDARLIESSIADLVWKAA